MATLTLTPPRQRMTSPIQTEPWWMAEPQGAEDNLLRDQAYGVLFHWNNRMEHLLEIEGADDYRSIPFEPIRNIHVVCKFVGELPPLPYPSKD